LIIQKAEKHILSPLEIEHFSKVSLYVKQRLILFFQKKI